MIETLIFTLIIVAISLSLLGVGIMIKGKFPNIHVDGNKGLNKQGIRCVESQDKAMRRKPKLAVSEKE